MRMKAFVSILGAMLLLWCAQALPAEAQAPREPGARFQTGTERIGGLRLGQPEAELASAIACPPVKTKEIYEGATGEYVQTWRFEGCGVVLKMASSKRGGAKTVATITIIQPSALATSRGIRVGSTEQEVLTAYGRFRDREGATKTGRQFVAGSIYDGLIVTFEKGKVVKIFLGAAAE